MRTVKGTDSNPKKGNTMATDYTEKSVEELEEILLDLKRQKLAIVDQQRAIQAIRRDKLDIYYLGQRLGIDTTGLTPEQARNLLDITRQTSRPGDVTVTPDTAVLTATTETPEV